MLGISAALHNTTSQSLEHGARQEGRTCIVLSIIKGGVGYSGKTFRARLSHKRETAQRSVWMLGIPNADRLRIGPIPTPSQRRVNDELTQDPPQIAPRSAPKQPQIDPRPTLDRVHAEPGSISNRPHSRVGRLD